MISSQTIEFILRDREGAYEPGYDEAALDAFAAAGRRAWADVPDAAAWVRELRGGASQGQLPGLEDAGEEDTEA